MRSKKYFIVLYQLSGNRSRGWSLRSLHRKEDITCRIGGDEFVLITPGGAGELEIIKQRLLVLEKVKEWIEPDERLGGLGVSIGAAVCKPDQKLDVDKPIDQADKHMYREKTNKPKTLPSFNRPG
ncbi:diguanylate cyclase [Thermacetogenium phaeum]|uniref:diguanylate cyclase n=1 Tax=Thermacetogenium phaeum TaxID=85874 RepID=UPI00048F79D7